MAEILMAIGHKSIRPVMRMTSGSHLITQMKTWAVSLKRKVLMGVWKMTIMEQGVDVNSKLTDKMITWDWDKKERKSRRGSRKIKELPELHVEVRRDKTQQFVLEMLLLGKMVGRLVRIELIEEIKPEMPLAIQDVVNEIVKLKKVRTKIT